MTTMLPDPLNVNCHRETMGLKQFEDMALTDMPQEPFNGPVSLPGFSVGDLVQIQSSGPPMTVKEVTWDKLLCCYAVDGVLVQDWWPIACLKTGFIRLT